MHFASRLALISIISSVIFAAVLDFASFHSDLLSGEGPGEGPVDAVPGAMMTVIDGSQVLAEQPPAYIPPPIPSVGSDHLGDLSKETIKQANPNIQGSSFDPQDPEMALDPPGPTGPLISFINPQPESSIPSSSKFSPPDVNLDPLLSWSAYKDDQSSGSAETSKSDDLATQHGCQPQAAPNSKFRARQESCSAPKQESVLGQETQESVPGQENVPKQESVPEQEIVPKQNVGRGRICPLDIHTLCCEEKGDFLIVLFPKKCKKCE